MTSPEEPPVVCTVVEAGHVEPWPVDEIGRRYQDLVVRVCTDGTYESLSREYAADQCQDPGTGRWFDEGTERVTYRPGTGNVTEVCHLGEWVAPPPPPEPLP